MDEAVTPDGRRPGRAEDVALVVAGYDDSEEAAEAVRWAASLARRWAASLRVVWAWKVRDVWDAAVAAQPEVFSPSLVEMEEVARARLTAILEDLLGEDARQVDVRLCQGPDSGGILLHAATDADVLVVGSRGRGRAGSALLGSVSAQCVREASCPVLVIPHRMPLPPSGPVEQPLAGFA